MRLFCAYRLLRKEVGCPADCVWPDQVVGQWPIPGPELDLRPLPGRCYLAQIGVEASRLIFIDHDAVDDGPVDDIRVLLCGRE